MQQKNLPNPFKRELATCPFNSAHTFEKQKLLFHISRCKDKQIRLPYLAKCKYNPLHYVEKDKILLHEQFCSDRQTNEEMHKKIESDYRAALRRDNRSIENGQRRDNNIDRHRRSSSREESRNGRSRSRERRQEVIKKQKLEKIEDDGKCGLRDEEEHTLSDCEECQNIIEKYKEQLRVNPRISKLIQKYQKISGQKRL